MIPAPITLYNPCGPDFPVWMVDTIGIMLILLLGMVLVALASLLKDIWKHGAY